MKGCIDTDLQSYLSLSKIALLAILHQQAYKAYLKPYKAYLKPILEHYGKGYFYKSRKNRND